MCGIGAILRITPPRPGGEHHEPIPSEWIDALDQGVAWRGADGAGRFQDRMTRPDGTVVEVAMVHRRLSIIDIEGGAQPMVVEGCPACERRRNEGAIAASDQPGKAAAVVFNGCIYNHRELRAELEAKGHVFSTDHSDTEVILHGFSEWREDLAGDGDSEDARRGKLEGMYAILIWDPVEGRVWAGRDSFREKPLWKTEQEGGRLLGWASTPQALRCLSFDGEPRLDRSGLTDLISLGFSLESCGQSESIREVETHFCPNGEPSKEPTTRRPFAKFFGDKSALLVSGFIICVVLLLLMWTANTVLTWVFGLAGAGTAISILAKLYVSWLIGVSVRASRPRLPLESVVTEIEQLLELSVAHRLEADVPVGCFLSGGVDSSLMALMASRHARDLVTLSVRMPAQRYDESRYAEMVADHLGTRHVTLDCDGSTAADDLVRLIRAMGIPFGDSSILPTYWLCREARKHVKVALAGDGGDELFCGYDRYKSSRYLWWPKRTLIGMLPTGNLDRSDPSLHSERKARLITAARHGGYLDLLAVFPTPDRRQLIGRHKGDIAGRLYVSFLASAMRGFDMQNYLPGDLLRKVDTASMLVGVEVRCPFLAPELVSAADAITARLHMRGGEGKHILKQIARRRLPAAIIDRPKQGFAIPISDWWRTDFGGLETLMMERLSKERPFGAVHDALAIRMPFVRRMIDEHRAAGGLPPRFTTRTVRRRDHGQRLFALVALSIWAERIG